MTAMLKMCSVNINTEDTNTDVCTHFVMKFSPVQKS